MTCYRSVYHKVSLWLKNASKCTHKHVQNRVLAFWEGGWGGGWGCLTFRAEEVSRNPRVLVNFLWFCATRKLHFKNSKHRIFYILSSKHRVDVKKTYFSSNSAHSTSSYHTHIYARKCLSRVQSIQTDARKCVMKSN